MNTQEMHDICPDCRMSMLKVIEELLTGKHKCRVGYKEGRRNQRLRLKESQREMTVLTPKRLRELARTVGKD